MSFILEKHVDHWVSTWQAASPVSCNVLSAVVVYPPLYLCLETPHCRPLTPKYGSNILAFHMWQECQRNFGEFSLHNFLVYFNPNNSLRQNLVHPECQTLKRKQRCWRQTQTTSLMTYKNEWAKTSSKAWKSWTFRLKGSFQKRGETFSKKRRMNAYQDFHNLCDWEYRCTSIHYR